MLGWCRRPRRRGPRATVGTIPHRQPAGPCRGERGSMPVRQPVGADASAQSVLHSLARGPGGTPGGLLAFRSGHVPLRQPGRRAGRRPVAGGRLREQLGRGLACPCRPTFAREKEREEKDRQQEPQDRRFSTEGGAGVRGRSRRRCAGPAVRRPGAGLNIEGVQRRQQERRWREQ